MNSVVASIPGRSGRRMPTRTPSPSASTTRTPMPAESSTTPTICSSPSARAPRCLREPAPIMRACCGTRRLSFVVRRCEIDYLQPARLDDLAGGGDPRHPARRRLARGRCRPCGATARISCGIKVKLACLNRPGGRRGCRPSCERRCAIPSIGFLSARARSTMAIELLQLAQATGTVQAVPTKPVSGRAHRASGHHAAAGDRAGVRYQPRRPVPARRHHRQGA